MSWAQVFAELGLKVDLTVALMTVGLIVSRVLPVVMLSPFLGGEVIPSEVKIGLGVTLAVVLYPGVVEDVRHVPLSAFLFVGILAKELFVGLCIAFIVSMVFEGALVAGSLVDTMAGTTMAQVMVPAIQQQVSLFSSLKLQMAVVFFLTLNGHHLVINALADSFIAIPLDRFPSFQHGAWPFFDLCIRVFADLLKIGLALSAPAFLAAFLTDLSLGMINRVAPQIQVFFISMSMKPMITILMMMIALHLVLERLQGEFVKMFRLLEDAIRLMA